MEFRIKVILNIVILVASLRNVQGIIGYDCGSSTANLTTLSLLNIEECDIPLPSVNTTQVYVQLLQLSDFQSVKVLQCKVEIDRTIRKCGMFSHTMDVVNGKYSYIQETSRRGCQRMHFYGTFEVSGIHITGLEPNSTTTRPATLAGKVNNDGSCSGGAYSDPYGAWSDVVVLSSIRITLQDYVADVRINSNRVQLRSGVACELSATHCTDIEGGDTYWEPVPADVCKTSIYGVLYEGNANKIIDTGNIESQVVYSLTTQNTLFALASKGTYMNCGSVLTRTEHPKLIIFETTPGSSTFKKHTQVANLDIFTYMNSKFVYVEKHIRTQINELYRNILYQQCHLEQKMLQNALAIATQSPDVFAYHLMKGPGYMALLAGEVIHIVKCVPVEVRVAQTTECYNQLPVLRGNKTYFLTPQTHLLLREGTQVNCNSFAPSMYLLGDAWYKLVPKPVESIPPTIIKPMTRPTWKYISPGSLATSGIYTEDDLADLRDHIMFPAERPAVLNSVVRGMLGKPVAVSGGSFTNLIDEAYVEKIAVSTWEKIWNRFLVFGNFSAGLIGIYLLVRIIKLLIDTVVHGYALHTIYGWSLYLIGAVWDSLTQLLLHLGRSKPKQTQETSLLNKNQENSILKEEKQENTVNTHLYPNLAKDPTYTLELKE